ncbi:MAG: SulP family inorganic anion transporter [Nanoarchaeota archaeon]|nr:SulP family inorganic anion transporter [Nanoarchaeota archaeon]
MEYKNQLKTYFRQNFLYDLKAGFITAVVALPLALAFAIASGVPPVMGLYTAIMAGILGSLFGGSIFSVTGPTGAMVVLILSTVTKFGIEGLLVAGLLAGIFQIGFGLLRVGKVVKYLPMPLISGFTAGIGAIIFIGQLGNALGLKLEPQEHVWQTVSQIFINIPNAEIAALCITLGTVLLLVFLPKILSKNKFTKNIPASIIALILFTVLAVFLALNIPVVGEIPQGLPSLSNLNFSWELVKNVLPSAFTIALLGSIEALLCAVVCDGMTGTKHNSNRELVTQGAVNVVMPFFGGMAATAAVARSAVNIREGAKTRYAGVIHGLFLLCTLLFLAPLAEKIPKAFLAGVLIVVAVKMMNVQEFKTVFRLSWLDTAVLVVTFALTVLTDLVVAVQVGMVLAILLLFIELTNIIEISHMEEYPKDTKINTLVNANPQLKENVSVYTINGPFFFGAMNVFDHKIDEHLQIKKPFVVLRMKYVPFIDSTGVVRLVEFIRKQEKHNSIVILTGVDEKVKKILLKDHEFQTLMKGEHKKQLLMFENTQMALEHIEKELLKGKKGKK